MRTIREMLFGSGGTRFESAAVTDCGFVRRENQDSHVDMPREAFFCVADGMGGGEGGAVASAWTCGELLEAARGGAAGREWRIAEAVGRANAKIRAFAAEQKYRMMGTTVAGLMLAADGEGGAPAAARIFHAGDSRVYRQRNGRLDLLTRDHTVGNEMAEATADLERAKEFRARSNPLTHVLTRAVGVEDGVRMEWRTVDVMDGDHFLLCTDGVHDMLTDGEIFAILKEGGSPARRARRLSEAVKSAGAGDNYTILCVRAYA